MSPDSRTTPTREWRIASREAVPSAGSNRYNVGMVAPVTNVSIPTDLARALEARAASAGMTLPAYIALLARVQIRQHDHGFEDATRHLFKTYPNALRKLAE